MSAPRGTNPTYRVIAGVVRPVLRAITRRDWRGAQHLPREGGWLAAANHATMIDPLTFAHYLYDHGVAPKVLAKESLFRVPLAGRLLRSSGQIPVHRNSSRARESLAGAVSALEAGECVAVFPEGTLTREPDLWPMAGRTGVARLALTTRVPVIPIAQWGAHRLLARYGRLLRPFPRKRVSVVAGPPVDLTDLYDRPQDSATLRDATVVAVAVPAQSARAVLEPLRGMLAADAVVVSLMKGVELSSDRRMSEVLSEALDVPADRVAVVSGPNLAKEIAVRQPTATVVAATVPETARTVAAACATAYFRPYTNGDVVGVELSGAVKNVIAVAVGIAQGLGYGLNTTATLITRGLVEITRLGLALGADAETFTGLAGTGDLVATCSSPLSRNHTLGQHIGRGLTLAEAVERTGGTAEAVKSSTSVLGLATTAGVDMPITQAVVAVLHEGLSVERMAQMLLNRPHKAEGVEGRPEELAPSGATET